MQYCKKWGHVKANCQKRKTDYLYAKLKNLIEKKENKRKKKIKRRRKGKENYR